VILAQAPATAPFVFARRAFRLTAAAVGACFANLFRAYRYVSAGTYDPKLDMSYWMRLILGLIAGYILAELISLDFDTMLGRPLLAILGGFSASAVFKFLERLVQSVETIVSADMSARADALVTKAKTEMQKETTKQHMDNVVDAYQFLVLNYEPGDHVFLFGFSRGAYTARSLAGLINKLGLLPKDHAFFTPVAYSLYRNQAAEPRLEKYRSEHRCCDVPIMFVGVWDTVGAPGDPCRALQAVQSALTVP
jgi:hypothetical protein